MAKAIVTAERLRRLLHYDPDTGNFTWLRPTYRQGHLVGTKAGHASGKYVEIRIDGRLYLAHRLAWLYTTGRWPVSVIDHVNCQPQDNRLANLREATPSQNSANKPALRTNACGLKGVRANPLSKVKPWRADIWSNGRARCLGIFATKEEAHAAYVAEATRLHGEFAHP